MRRSRIELVIYIAKNKRHRIGRLYSELILERLGGVATVVVAKLGHKPTDIGPVNIRNKTSIQGNESCIALSTELANQLRHLSDVVCGDLDGVHREGDTNERSEFHWGSSFWLFEFYLVFLA